jgi:hypothetical protein
MNLMEMTNVEAGHTDVVHARCIARAGLDATSAFALARL